MGRIRDKLSDRLTEEIRKLIPTMRGFQDCDPEKFFVAEEDLILQPNGGSLFADWARWRLNPIKIRGWYFSINGYSFDTMTECSKGLTLEQDDAVGQLIIYGK